MRFLFLTMICATLAVVPAGAAVDYKLSQSIAIPGPGGWDYLAADSAGRRLYVSHGTEVVVVDLDSHAIVGTIPGTNGVHGIAIATDLGRGFISAGRDNAIVIFDLKTMKVLGTAKTGTNPDGILYEPTTHRVFAFNGRSSDATVIEGATGELAGTIPVGGKPEFPVADGKGNVFVNIEDKNEIEHIDPKTLKVLAHWPLGAESPSGLAIDTSKHRLFAVCDGKVMAVVNYDNGKVVAKVAIGEGPDAAAFDPETQLAFASNGQDGTLTVVQQDSADKYTVAQTVATQKSARTLAVDLKTHTVYLPAAEFGPAPAATPENPRPRPAMKAGTFKLVVVTK